MMWDVLINHLEDHATQRVIEEPWRDLDWTREPEVRAGARPLIADEAKTAQFIASKGVVLNTEAQALFLDCVLDQFIAAIILLERRAQGRYDPDERPSQFPKFDGKKITRSASKLSPWQLFGAWVAARPPAASSINRWRRVFIDLERHLVSRNADDISEDDAREWARQLVTSDRKAGTVNDVWLSAARRVFGWAEKERLISSNPFEGPNPCDEADTRSRYHQNRQGKDGSDPRPCYRARFP